MRAFIKIFLCLCAVLSYFIFALPLYPLLFLFPYFTRKILTNLAGLHCRFLLNVLNVKLTHNVPKDIQDKNFLIVCNHLSYLDIFVLNSILPSCFVTSVEMKQTPGLGQICTLGGCLFVERRSRNNIVNEIKEIENALTNGLNVAFYPEAKSTDGSSVLPFKRSLFQAAVNTNSPTAVFAINYQTIDGEEVTIRNRDSLFWYGTMAYSPHFIQLCQKKSIDVNFEYIETINPHEYKDDSSLLRDKAYNLVSAKYKPIK